MRKLKIGKNSLTNAAFSLNKLVQSACISWNLLIFLTIFLCEFAKPLLKQRFRHYLGLKKQGHFLTVPLL